MRPALKAGLRPLWRDRDTLQIGIDPRRAVALGQLGSAAAVISLLDGSRDRAALLATARSSGVPVEAAIRVLSLLASAGLLDDFPAALHRSLPVALRDRLAPDLAAASLAYGDADGGARTLARRRGSVVGVHGCGRIGAATATLLAASGVGQVICTDPVPARTADAAPAGLLPADAGTARAEAAAAAVRRVAPETDTQDRGIIPDLLVLTGMVSPDLVRALLHDGVPHLNVRAAEAIGVVGPLVLPGRSACLRCLDLHRADRDPAWPKILAQATCASVGATAVTACDAVLAVATAALACAQALLFLDGVVAPVTVNGTLDLVQPGWQWHRRSWAPHPRCTCGAAGATGGLRGSSCDRRQ